MSEKSDWSNPDNWNDWFWGIETTNDAGLFEERERQYAAFIGRLLSEGYIVAPVKEEEEEI